MAAMDEFRKEREAVKNGTFRQKLSYFWDYYKWHAIIPTVIIICIASFIYHKFTDPETILNGILLNTYSIESDSSDLMNGFYEEQEIDRKLYDISLNTTLSYYTEKDAATSNYQTLQALMAWTAAGQVDFISGDLEAMTELAYKGYFDDLREILTEEQIAQYEPYFLYMDQAVIEKRNEAYDNQEDASLISIPECDKPETMEKPIPVLLNLPPGESLVKAYGYDTNEIIFGIPSNAEHLEMALHFIEYATDLPQ